MSRALGRQRRRSRRSFVFAVAVLAGLVESALPATGQQAYNFSAIASAETSEIVLDSAALPIATSYDIGMPGAQAELDSLGQSRAYAAAPYPSETLVTAPGLLASIGVPLIPPYPMIVKTEAPTSTDDEISQGPVLLRVHSEEAMSSGLAQIAAAPGVSATAATATVKTDSDGKPVVATGDSVFDGLSLASRLLAIGRVHSRAEASVGVDGSIAVASSFEATGLSIAGVALEIGDGGLELAGNRLVPIPLDQLNGLLKGANIQLDYLAPVVDPDGRGITAGGLRVTYVVAGVLQAPLTVTQTIGRARARINAATAVPPTPAGGPPAPQAQPPAGVVGGPPAPAPVVPTSTGSPPLPSSPAPIAAALPVGPAIAQFQLLAVYVVLVLAGGLLAGGGRFFRYVGVQQKWI